MSERSLAFANGAALAAKHSRPGHPVTVTTTTTVHASDLATRTDSCQQRPVRILTVSRIDPRKGLRVLPAVVQWLRARSLEVTLDIIGPVVGRPGEEERAAILAETARLGLEAVIHAVGPVPLDRLMARYREYDVFVLPTLPGEGIPRVLLEAMTAGLPVVTTRVAGIPSLVTHEVNGLLVEEPAAETIADAIGRVITDVALRRRLIANGYESARGFTVDAQAARLLSELATQLKLELRPANLEVRRSKL
jgi:glycosyltransferase involved in cell wall biosynthesis